MKTSKGFRLPGSALALLIAFATPLSLRAATVTMTADDATGSSSLISGSKWSDSAVPSSANDYVAAHVIRTPAATGNYTFAGASLTLNSGGEIAYKGTNSSGTDVITINNLTVNSGAIITNLTGYSYTLAGSLIVTAGNTAVLQVTNNSLGFVVTAPISGAGGLSLTSTWTSANTSRAITLNAVNTYSGGTTIGTNTAVTAASDGAFGSGNVTMSGGILTLAGGSTNNYIGDSASFIIATGLSAYSIIFTTGTDTVGALSLNGGTTFLANGTYTVAQLNTAYGSTLFSGAGSIKVLAVPEPSTYVLLVLGLGGLLWNRRRMILARR